MGFSLWYGQFRSIVVKQHKQTAACGHLGSADVTQLRAAVKITRMNNVKYSFPCIFSKATFNPLTSLGAHCLVLALVEDTEVLCGEEAED